MTDVCLVQMPYSGLQQPSIALGLLKAGLTAENIEARVVHANLMWAEAIGFDVYLVVQETDPSVLAGEWTFAAAAFGEAAPAPEGYLRSMLPAQAWGLWAPLKALHPGLDGAELLAEVRRRASAFVDRVADQILQERPRVVGCSSMFQQHCASLALLRRIREKAPEVVTVLGGANCEGDMGRATHRAFPWVDFVFSGDADTSFPKLCADVLTEGREIAEERLPASVLGPKGRGSAERGGGTPAAVFPDLDRAQVPDYSDYFQSLEASPLAKFITPALQVETSRGCWWGQAMACSFCGLNGVRVGYRSKSADRVLRELEELSRRHGIDRLCFVDNVLDMRFFRDVLPALQEAGAPYRIVYEVRSHLGRHHLEQLTRAGCRSMQPGIESLHDEVLKLLRKGTTTLQHVAFLKWARELGIRLAWAILCGAPGERDEWYMEMAEWLPWIAHLHPPKGAMTIRFDRFGRYHLAPSEHALRLRPMPAYSFVYPLEEAAVRDLAYFFRHSPESGTPPSWVVDPAARPGLRAVQEAVGRWKADFWSVPESERASLTATRRDGELVIEDSRPGASERSLALRGLERSIYEECDAPRTRGDLARRLAEKHQLPHGEEELDAALASLGERKLLLSMGGRHLALALRSPAVPLPDDRESAEGFVAALKVVASSAKTSLARQVALHPFDLPLVDAWRAASHAHAAAAP